ncbi:hypothetical protein EJ06DRAFT_240883 [Trichodelitschia bisporula]|uniref:Rhodopsin domain-containing protein n=1 Tax=Trichodelitschia bisporula TaxID=703511 RepID=A0A6G1HK64_9PEZI|nr:hypothetical protein EJ06DRAFT_240883 [Trichodelitschia bisporula]
MAGDTPSKAPAQIAVVAVLVVLTMSAVGLRLWVRIRMIRSLGWDDIFMVVALFNFLMYDSSLMTIVHYGGGTHITDQSDLRAATSWILVAETFYLTTILFLKLSLGFFFLRVAIKKWQRRTIITTMTVSTIIHFYHIFFVIFMCGDPRNYLQNRLNHKCVGRNVEVALAYEQAAVTTATDWIFALLPIPMLWNTSMDLRSKLSVGFVLSLGALGSICSMIRFKYIEGLGSHDDFFWSAANVSTWSILEMGTGIIAGCLATMRPLFKRFMYRAAQLTSRTNGTSSRSWLRSHRKHPSRTNGSGWAYSTNSTFTTTCVGGKDVELGSPGDELHSVFREEKDRRRFPAEVWSADPERAVIWPYSNHAGPRSVSPAVEGAISISKVVDVEVSVVGPDDLWPVVRGIQRPERAKSPPQMSGDVPEWERMPDLVTPEERGHGRKGSGGSSKSRGGSPVRIN